MKSRIWMPLSTTWPANGLVEIRVIDSGPGIPADYRKKIFDRFQQVSRGDGKKKEGTGL